MSPGIIVALVAASISVISSLSGLIQSARQKKSKVIVKTDGERQEFELTNEQVERLKKELKQEQKTARVAVAH